jgi:hypothetical protein
VEVARERAPRGPDRRELEAGSSSTPLGHPGGRRRRLYDIRNDPLEREDFATSRPDAARLRAILLGRLSGFEAHRIGTDVPAGEATRQMLEHPATAATSASRTGGADEVLTFQAKLLPLEGFSNAARGRGRDVDQTVEEAVVAFVHAEERRRAARLGLPEDAQARRGANKRGMKNVSLHSFTHLGAASAPAAFAQAFLVERRAPALDRLRRSITPFGWFCECGTRRSGDSRAKWEGSRRRAGCRGVAAPRDRVASRAAGLASRILVPSAPA